MVGPVIGGWLTDNLSWRRVFYINLPLGMLAFPGVSAFVTGTKVDMRAQLDWLGFGSLSVGIGALQILLDRDEQLGWFGSGRSSSKPSSPPPPSTCSSSRGRPP